MLIGGSRSSPSHQMCAQFSAEEDALFEKTGAAVLRRLRKTRNPADFLSVLGTAHKEFDRAFASAPLAAREKVACRAGCDFCCHVQSACRRMKC